MLHLHFHCFWNFEYKLQYFPFYQNEQNKVWFQVLTRRVHFEPQDALVKLQRADGRSVPGSCRKDVRVESEHLLLLSSLLKVEEISFAWSLSKPEFWKFDLISIIGWSLIEFNYVSFLSEWLERTDSRVDLPVVENALVNHRKVPGRQSKYLHACII